MSYFSNRVVAPPSRIAKRFVCSVRLGCWRWEETPRPIECSIGRWIRFSRFEKQIVPDRSYSLVDTQTQLRVALEPDTVEASQSWPWPGKGLHGPCHRRRPRRILDISSCGHSFRAPGHSLTFFHVRILLEQAEGSRMNCNLHCSTAVQLSGAIHPWGEEFLKKGNLIGHGYWGPKKRGSRAGAPC